jgi:uncharacterized protein (DUF488 family)
VLSTSDDRSSSPGMLFTVGHGPADQEHLTRLLAGAGIEVIVDVRRSPGSRRFPHVARRELEVWLPAAGIAYRWEERLGGRRSRAPASPNTALRDPALQGYADHLNEPAFLAAIDRLIADVAARRTAVMCAESDWTRCHRRFIADHVALLTDVEVHHLGHDHQLRPHRPSAEVRVEDGRLIYDGGAPTLDLEV